MAGCIFCDIVAGRTSASVVYEDDTAVAFLDLFPVHQGHTLVIPREHCADRTACDPEVAGHLMQVSAALGPRLVRALSADGYNVWTARRPQGSPAEAGGDLRLVHRGVRHGRSPRCQSPTRRALKRLFLATHAEGLEVLLKRDTETDAE